MFCQLIFSLLWRHLANFAVTLTSDIASALLAVVMQNAVCTSYRNSVRPSATFRYCVQTNEDRPTIVRLEGQSLYFLEHRAQITICLWPNGGPTTIFSERELTCSLLLWSVRTMEYAKPSIDGSGSTVFQSAYSVVRTLTRAIESM